jgi:hypothetical protein
MRFFLLLTVLTVGLMTVSAEAGEFGNYTLTGEGGRSCGIWTKLRRDRREGLDAQWILGFLSGAAHFEPSLDPMNGVDAQGIFVWIDNYCLAHPIEQIVIASAAFVYAHPR